jgi:hypothetical protein
MLSTQRHDNLAQLLAQDDITDQLVDDLFVRSSPLLAGRGKRAAPSTEPQAAFKFCMTPCSIIIFTNLVPPGPPVPPPVAATIAMNLI